MKKLFLVLLAFIGITPLFCQEKPSTCKYTLLLTGASFALLKMVGLNWVVKNWMPFA